MPDYSKPFKSTGYEHYYRGYKILHKTGGKHIVYDVNSNVIGKFDNEQSAMNFMLGKAGK